MERNNPDEAKRASYTEQAARVEEANAAEIDGRIARQIGATTGDMPAEQVGDVTPADEVGTGLAGEGTVTGDRPDPHGPHAARHGVDPLTIRDPDEPQSGGSGTSW